MSVTHKWWCICLPSRNRLGSIPSTDSKKNTISFFSVDFICIFALTILKNNKLVLHDRITKRDTLSINNYFNELQEYYTLTPEEEHELSVLSYEGDEDARNKLIKHNLRFVISVAKQYEGNGTKIEDLINEGNIGLINAAEKFDPTKGFKFISYAVHWIKRYIVLYINNDGKLVRTPMNKVESNGQIKKVIEPIEKELGRPLGYDELFGQLIGRFTKGQIDFYSEEATRGVDSLDREWDDGGSIYGTFMSDNDDTYNPSNNLDSKDSSKLMSLLFDQLTDNEQKVLTLYYGLGDNEPVKLKDVGGLIDLTYIKVCSAKFTGLRKLRNHMNDNAEWILKD